MGIESKYLPAGQRREVIVDTVIDLAGEQNPSEITTAAIAKRMGLTQGALFRHFQSKDAVLEAVMRQVSDRLMLRISKAENGSSSSIGKLENMFITHIKFIKDHPGIPRLLFGELQSSKKTEPKKIAQMLLSQYKKRLISIIEDGKEKGEFDLELNSDAAATLFIGTIQGLIMQSLLASDKKAFNVDACKVFDIYKRGLTGAI
ncbi:MAG: TetR/AcrR family transcriptional regulator [Nitrospirae bacterium]|nr:TetR/AcrR family transcriptional regulator [Nitrospirota bacterium]